MPHRSAPQVALPRHRSVEVAPEAMPSIDSTRFQPMDKMELTQIHWPTVIGLEASNQPPNRPPIQIFTRATPTTAFWSQPEPEDQDAVHPRADRRPLAAAWRPRVATNLLAAYKYPSLYTINRGYEAWWRGAPFIFQAL
jgi:hypothetical protein